MELRHNLANGCTVTKCTIEEVRDLLAVLLQGINLIKPQEVTGNARRNEKLNPSFTGATDSLEAK